ncbi:hypothetical protein AVEN_107835-1, partial [Araneus ventricosus]
MQQKIDLLPTRENRGMQQKIDLLPTRENRGMEQKIDLLPTRENRGISSQRVKSIFEISSAPNLKHKEAAVAS